MDLVLRVVMVSDWPNGIGRIPKAHQHNLMQFKGYCMIRSCHELNVLMQHLYKETSLAIHQGLFPTPTQRKVVQAV